MKREIDYRVFFLKKNAIKLHKTTCESSSETRIAELEDSVGYRIKRGGGGDQCNQLAHNIQYNWTRFTKLEEKVSNKLPKSG